MKSAIFATVLALLLGSTAAFSDLQRPQNMGQVVELVREFSEAQPNVDRTSIDYLHDAVEVHLTDGTSVKIFAGNLYTKLRDAENDTLRQVIFDFHMAAAADKLLNYDSSAKPIDLNRVYPVLRHQSFRRVEEDSALETQPVSQPAFGDVSVYYVEDSEKSVAYISAQRLEQFGSSDVIVKAQAMQNLAGKFDDLTVEGDGLFYLVLDGFYESSFLLYEPLWVEIDAQIGEVLMVVPTREIVIFADGNYTENRTILADLAAEFHADGPYSVTDLVFRWSGQTWDVVK